MSCFAMYSCVNFAYIYINYFGYVDPHFWHWCNIDTVVNIINPWAIYRTTLKEMINLSEKEILFLKSLIYLSECIYRIKKTGLFLKVQKRKYGYFLLLVCFPICESDKKISMKYGERYTREISIGTKTRNCKCKKINTISARAYHWNILGSIFVVHILGQEPSSSSSRTQ